ncbi:MAG: M13 family peptidase, partial [Myxococcales bacterium]|nr:M13 family peptidase [Myxococcales bacterium]
WSTETGGVFKQKGQCVEKQYSGYEVLPGLKQNGKLTLGENIADVGGIKLAFRAYRELRSTAKEEIVADGFREDQQFFLSVGQIWCSKYTEKSVRLLTQVDPHANARFRVNGPLSQLPEFAAAFKCRADSKMAPAERCSVW